jgi:Ion channel
MSSSEQLKLLKIYLRGREGSTAWRRAQILMLSAEGLETEKIAHGLREDENFVRAGIRDFNAAGLSSVSSAGSGSTRPESGQPEVVSIAWGGQVVAADFIMWPALGLMPLLAMLPIPLLGALLLLAVGILCVLLLMWPISMSTRAEAWVEGSRIQFPIMIGSFLAGQMMTYASAYDLVSHHVHESFSQPLTAASSVYFSVTTWTTAGFGDVHPNSWPGQMLVVAELLTAVATVTVLLATAASKAFERR